VRMERLEAPGSLAALPAALGTAGALIYPWTKCALPTHALLPPQSLTLHSTAPAQDMGAIRSIFTNESWKSRGRVLSGTSASSELSGEGE
jgi:hypothetical protein